MDKLDKWMEKKEIENKNKQDQQFKSSWSDLDRSILDSKSANEDADRESH